MSSRHTLMRLRLKRTLLNKEEPRVKRLIALVGLLRSLNKH
jgi:hypothetical protein